MSKEELKDKLISEAQAGWNKLNIIKRVSGSEFSYYDGYIDCGIIKEKQISELEAQIEKMKCGGNCKHLYHVNTGGCYDAKCDLTYCDCTNCKDEWELRR